MLFHRLKPHQGWPTFAWEVVIVVLGVGIALLAQQWAENRTWDQRVAAAERQLRNETNENFFYAAERVRVRPCIDAQADRLIAILLAGGDRIPPQQSIESSIGEYAVRTPSRPYLNTAWAGIVSDGVAARFDEDRRKIIAMAYTQIGDLNPSGERENAIKGDLSLMLFPLPLSDATRERLIERAMALKNNNALMALKATQIMTSLVAVSLAPPERQVEERLRTTKVGTSYYCLAQGLPLADWRKLLDEEIRSAIADGDVGAELLKKARR